LLRSFLQFEPIYKAVIIETTEMAIAFVVISVVSITVYEEEKGEKDEDIYNGFSW